MTGLIFTAYWLNLLTSAKEKLLGLEIFPWDFSQKFNSIVKDDGHLIREVSIASFILIFTRSLKFALADSKCHNDTLFLS